MQINNFFDKIFVITIGRNKSRWPLIDQQLQGCDFRYFQGIDASGMDFDALKNRYADIIEIDDNLKHWSVGQIGCWLSHLTLLKKIVDEKINFTLILEDDLIFESSNLQKNYKAFQTIPYNKFDIFYMGYAETCSVNRKYKSPFLRNLFRLYYIFKNINRVPTFDMYKRTFLTKLKCFPKAVNNDIDKAGYSYGTHAYAVTLAGAQKILELFQKIKIPIDRAYSEAVVTGRLNGLALNKQIFFQNQSLISSINNI